MTNPWQGQKKLVGFNLLNLFALHQKGPSPFEAQEFALMADWGFNFVRLPIDHRYLLHADADIDAIDFHYLDQAVVLGERYGLHINLNLHNAPGFCINTPRETWTLWSDTQVQARFIALWEAFAHHYRGLGNRISFNLVNEATGCDLATYTDLMSRTARAVQAIDASIPIIIDGHDVGRTPVPGAIELGLAQSVHCYEPHWFTHYKASWVYRNGDPYAQEPEYPGSEPARKDGRDTNPDVWNRDRLVQFFSAWQGVIAAGGSIHCGEFGVYNTTDRASTLRWFSDVLDVLDTLHAGWALWNLQGSFGIIESGRPGSQSQRLPDGRWLDTELLQLLQRHR